MPVVVVLVVVLGGLPLGAAILAAALGVRNKALLLAVAAGTGALGGAFLASAAAAMASGQDPTFALLKGATLGLIGGLVVGSGLVAWMRHRAASRATEEAS